MYLTGETFFYRRDRRRGEKKGELFDLGYWRKHPNLHGFIVENFADGVDNCQPIDLEPGDLVRIVEAIQAEDLPHTEGFFFGKSDGSEKQNDLETFRAAIAWVNEDAEGELRSVSYRASW
ncbi:MAG TPA: phosphoglycerate kinase [Phycisphaerae bacterium]|jgi:hypothetical protein|nr:phosphoglycerate kinase [Phycisphaerae bacterium]